MKPRPRLATEADKDSYSAWKKQTKRKGIRKGTWRCRMTHYGGDAWSDWFVENEMLAKCPDIDVAGSWAAFYAPECGIDEAWSRSSKRCVSTV